MPAIKQKRLCARTKCQKRFTPTKDNQKYCGSVCKNRAAQERLRERARRNGFQKEEAR